ncbi:MAG TPA: acyl-CoA dehydrogenase family protein [Candidatus Binataceae bacterium]|nr:acyl-CoA dehydrogenase family protein [Candidatus Binataceae bacterium]
MIDYRKYESSIGLNWYEADPNLQQIAHRMLEPADLDWCEPELRRAGALVGSHIAARAEVTDKNPPQLVKYDRWGEPADEIVHHPGTLATKREAWVAGISGPRLRNEAARRGRRYPDLMTAALNYLLSQAETGMLCAVGMTTGVIALVRRYAPAALREEMLAHLTAEDFDDAWDGAMFMTEKTGGSDLATLTTVARQDGDRWILNGSKWFCSNVDAGVIVTLARPEGATDGLKGIALFLVPRRRADGRRNGIEIRRLKDKLGTRAVPTAEVDFVDAEAYLMAGENADAGAARDGRGINRMMEMVDMSRQGVAVMGLGIMRRSFLESAIFAAHRTAFGNLLRDLPLMRETLVAMVVELEAASALVFASAADDSAISRLLVPLAKLRATRRGVELASQAVEVHGGNGYIENWPVARQFRDAQCHTIWEGTENIICLDVLRALRNEQVVKAAFGTLERRLAAAPPILDEAREPVARALGEIRQALEFLSRAERDLAQLRARTFANYLADVAQAALLFDEAAWELEHRGSARKAVIANLFVRAHLTAPAARGLLSRDRAVLNLFEELTGYGEIDPARAQAALHIV